jgi:hypothetical protein
MTSLKLFATSTSWRSNSTMTSISSTEAAVKHVVQLHLSQDCNRPHLAASAAGAVLNGTANSIRIHTARQDETGPAIALVGLAQRHPAWFAKDMRPAAALRPAQRYLPGWEGA